MPPPLHNYVYAYRNLQRPLTWGGKKKKKKTEGGGGGGMIEVIILSYDNTKYNWPHTDSRHLSIKLLFTH